MFWFVSNAEVLCLAKTEQTPTDFTESLTIECSQTVNTELQYVFILDTREKWQVWL